MTIDEFVQRELERTGKRLFTVKEVCEMTERFIAEKQAAAAPFEGWKSDQEIDRPHCRGTRAMATVEAIAPETKLLEAI